MHPAAPSAAPPTVGTAHRVLFDDTKAETAGNADWIISTRARPAGQNANPTSETAWTGALSSWGVALQQTGGYALNTLPPADAITYGDVANPLDLTNFNAFVLPEPNVLFTRRREDRDHDVRPRTAAGCS